MTDDGRQRTETENRGSGDGERRYPVLCAWCLKEGVETVLKMVDYPNSHGICPRHADELQEQARRYAAALGRDVADRAA